MTTTTTEASVETPTVLLAALIAAEKGVKQRTEREITDLMRELGRTPLTTGLARTYQPKDEEGDQLPAETTLVQVKADQVLDEIAAKTTGLIDLVLTREAGNAEASGDVYVDGQKILEDIPVTAMLFLEKQLRDVITILRRLPVLDPAKSWSYDANTGVYKSEPRQTTKTEKVLQNHVKHPGTQDGKVQPQVETFNKDVVVGYYTTVDMSGALPADRVKKLIERAEKLLDGVKFAREACNSTKVEQRQVGARMFSWLLGA